MCLCKRRRKEVARAFLSEGRGRTSRADITLERERERRRRSSPSSFHFCHHFYFFFSLARDPRYSKREKRKRGTSCLSPSLPFSFSFSCFFRIKGLCLLPPLLLPPPPPPPPPLPLPPLPPPRLSRDACTERNRRKGRRNGMAAELSARVIRRGWRQRPWGKEEEEGKEAFTLPPFFFLISPICQTRS